MTVCFVVVDTESSIRCDDSTRVLMSLAYEVVVASKRGLRVASRHYDLVSQPLGVQLDSVSERVHGISALCAHQRGRSLYDVVRASRACAWGGPLPYTILCALLPFTDRRPWWDMMSSGTPPC